MRISRSRVLVVAVGVVLVASACGARGGSSEANEDPAPTTGISAAAEEVDTGGFGSLTELCGDGSFSVAPDEQGLGNGRLNLGVATDRSSEVRPGLNKELWDTSLAFAQWCNARGGIGGLEINLVELNGSLFNVEAAMSTACNDVFAMVGGGFVQDDLEFSGQDGSDFHACGMIDLPAFAASSEKSGSNGQVQPVPNTPDTELNTIFRDYKELYPDEAERAVIVYGELPTMETSRDKYQDSLADAGIEVAGTVSYPVVGVTDWTPYAQSVMQTGANTLTYVGEPANLAALLARLREQGWDGIPVLQTNMYDEQLFSNGTTGPDGAIVRMPAHPFEEAADWPATQQYLDLLDEYVPDARRTLLGVQSMSAWLLFTVAANACAAANDGVLDRTCILEQAASQPDWSGGGLHAPQPLAPFDQASTSPCTALVVVEDGGFTRLYPEVGGTDDDGDGFHCPSNGVTTVEDPAAGNVDPSRPL
jgi:Periplasmic binding protein